MTTPKLQDILSWASLTSQLFGISRDKALETADGWQGESVQEQAPAVTCRNLGKLVADTLRSASDCTVINGEVSMDQRRRAVLDTIQANSPNRLDNLQTAEATFVLAGLTQDERRRVITACREDLDYWSTMNVIRKEGREFWFPTGGGNGSLKESRIVADLLSGKQAQDRLP